MSAQTFAEKLISKNHMGINIASVTIGVGILTFPRTLAKATGAFDGWISVILSGLIAWLIGWMLAKLAARFPRQTFFEYTSIIASKPVGYVLTILVCVYTMLFVSFEIRAIGNISKQYLFYETPVEMITLSFLLIVQYAVAGSRIAMLRLNLLFLPVVFVVIAVVLLFTTQLVEIENVRPFFSSDWRSLLKGTEGVGLSYSGFEVILFYTMLMRNPQEGPRAIAIGLAIPVLLYLTIYMFVIGVFSAEVAKNLTYPTIELAKEVEIPGGFFERVESIFFTIWIMTIFNTCAMWLDITIINLTSMFQRVTKILWIFILSPLIYFIAMLPQNLVDFFTFAEKLTYYGFLIVYLVPIGLLLLAKLRGVKGHE
ncbi:germination protein GerLB [Brevibacillus reuszeri]|uniref:Germination protein GerLB n=1 Tax=Brevibacillus reuszeri TaxID=54915 RepID=A0A0K9YJA3_9BACL|nr:endospore germination permease [Brevibacillus reuszeri]KNB68736.1 spore gernimation protein [Brevibacillus reuszeri]MED1859033.1 endospore germination permease [Brevibacillus reuszeri]GED69252.1 germination protein GerLB [Brevibacillus reuszeri]